MHANPKDNSRAGIAAIVLALAVSLLLFILAYIFLDQGNTTIQTGTLLGQGNQADALAQGAVQDALIRIAQDGTWYGTYNLPQANGSSTVTVLNNSSTVVTINVTSSINGGVFAPVKFIQAVVNLDANGKVVSVTQTAQ